MLAKSNDKIHPVIGLWDINLLKNLEENLKNGTRKIMYWVKNHPYDTENFRQDCFDPFFNINFENDLIEAKNIEDKYI